MLTPVAARIGIHLDDLRLPPRAALRVARELGFGQVELSTTDGMLSPEQMSRTARRELSQMVGELGLRIGAFNDEPQSHQYYDGMYGERAQQHTIAVMEFAREMSVPVVVSSLAVAPNDDERVQALLRETLATLADFSDRIGVALALMPRGVTPAWMSDTLNSIGCPTLGAGFDSGHWLMAGINPADAAAALGGWIRWVHLRDAVPGASLVQPGYETAHGSGHLDARAVLAAIDAVGYGGAMVVRRTSGGLVRQELGQGLEFWRKVIV